MAIDFGAKRTGLAVTDPQQLIATSLATIETKQVLTYIKNYCAKEPVETMVLGYPFNYGHQQNAVIPLLEKFKKELERQLPDIPVVLADERFSSKLASRTIAMSGLKKSARENKSMIDQISATIILQDFLEQKKNRMH